jgi:hypothetical protein
VAGMGRRRRWVEVGGGERHTFSRKPMVRSRRAASVDCRAASAAAASAEARASSASCHTPHVYTQMRASPHKSPLVEQGRGRQKKGEAHAVLRQERGESDG